MLIESKKEYFKNLFHQKLNELLLKANDTVRDLASPKDVSYELVDQASRESEAEYSFRMRERESKLIAKIKEALERIEEGTFGICEECGEEISEERLEARPVTTLCIKCKTKQEVDEKKRV